uniref:AAA-ATPase-like domain-containing protein n=1 Tax=Ditylenchus dipsaci TaxID=166011 RepID=A0A915E410_9BILA
MFCLPKESGKTVFLQLVSAFRKGTLPQLGFSIFNRLGFVDRTYGKFSVIELDFGTINALDFASLMTATKNMMLDAMLAYNQIRPRITNANLMARFDKYYIGDFSAIEAVDVVRLLAAILKHIYPEKPVLLLVDNFDSPLLKLWDSVFIRFKESPETATQVWNSSHDFIEKLIKALHSIKLAL